MGGREVKTIYMIYNRVSDPLTEPQFNKDQPVFTHINSSHARLNLQGWANGGCPISAVTLEFRPKGQCCSPWRIPAVAEATSG